MDTIVVQYLVLESREVGNDADSVRNNINMIDDVIQPLSKNMEKEEDQNIELDLNTVLKEIDNFNQAKDTIKCSKQ